MNAGRNDPCPCGSGKKYKRCHGMAPAPASPPPLSSRQVQAAELGHRGALQLVQGQAEAALTTLRQALALDPDHAGARANLGAVLKQLERPDEAEAALRAALERDPRIASAHSNLGALLMARHDSDALACFDRAIALDPQFADAHFNRASLLREQGRIGDAITALRRVVTLVPDWLPAWGNLLLSLLYADDVTAADVAAWHRRFDTLLGMLHSAQGGAPIAAPPPVHQPGQRLRIGYLSPDLRRHAVARFFEPLLAHHDQSAFEVFCYHDHPLEDEVSTRLQQQAGHWLNCAAMPHAALADRIRADRIDVLIDLAGHTGLRMPVFALRPAPLQLTWLGYPASTGLAAIAHRISDHRADPPAHDALHSEQLLRLPHSYFCFLPPADAPAPGPLPRLQRGHLMFGSFNNISKLSPATVALWAQVLRAVPDAQLTLKAAGLADAGVCERLRTAFAAAGVAAARIHCHGWAAHTQAHLAAYDGIDIALDTTPYNGATTTCEALWMGVPVISVAGDRSQARMGASILTAAGLHDWLASDGDAAVAIARRWADDPPALAQLRAGLRAQIGAAPLCDAAGFARDFEAALRNAWADVFAARMRPLPEGPP